MRWNHYLSIVIGLLYLVMFTYEYFNKYFEINNGKIKLFSIPAEEILVSEIYDVKYYAGDYIFKTADKTIKIVKSQINKKQLSEFEASTITSVKNLRKMSYNIVFAKNGVDVFFQNLVIKIRKIAFSSFNFY